MKKPVVDVGNAAVAFRPDYAAILERIKEEGLCPFCEEHLLKHHTKPILKRGHHWLVTENFKPYKGAVHHFLVISLHHVERIEDLPPGAAEEMVEMYRFLVEEYRLSGATIVWRSGNMAVTGATVGHLHFQVVVGVPRGDDTATITPVVGFGKTA